MKIFLQRTVLISLLVLCFSHLAIVAQEKKSDAAASGGPLTDEQIAVYRAVLDYYMKDNKGPINIKDNKGPINVADTTGALQDSPLVDEDCAKQFNVKKSDNSTSVVHKLPVNIAPNLNIILVDPDQQMKRIEANDPQKLVRSSKAEGKHVTKEQIADSVQAAFAAGLFTLSEIVFDHKHQRALAAYSFVCGGLCGHGNTLILEKVGSRWKVINVCGGWVS